MKIKKVNLKHYIHQHKKNCYIYYVSKNEEKKKTGDCKSSSYNVKTYRIFIQFE